jgi:catechol 2,3-dioxygenase-like lactoylglutathione lyase family enzyme
MLGYATVGTRDLARAKPFFDEVLAPLGLRRVFENERICYWGASSFDRAIGVCKPFDGGPAGAGNGCMLALLAPSRATVDIVHARALALGGRDEGPPGLRSPESDEAYYGAYFRDLDGNKFVVYRFGGPQ